MIGSALVKALEDINHAVVAVDKKEPYYTNPKLFVRFDLCEEPLELKKKLQPENVDIDLIIHLAANARVWDLTQNPQGALENVTTTHNIFEFARICKVQKIIFASSREVYGNDVESFPVSEGASSQRDCESVYAASKIFGESYCFAYNRCFGIDAQIVRFSNVYGKYDHSDRFIPKMIRQLRDNQDVVIFNGEKLLDFTFIDDTVSGVLHLITHWPCADSKREWNIASGKAYKLLYVVERLKQLLHSSSQILLEPTRPGEVCKYQANLKKMNSIGWKPIVELEEGLRKSIEYYN